MRCLELFAGIGGCAAALGRHCQVVAAVDQSRVALEVYRHNFPAHPAIPKAVQTLTDREWEAFDADLWWLSPPCPPYTPRGLRRDLDDPRAASLVTAVERIRRHRPRHVGFENVPGFDGSRAHALLRDALRAGAYHVREIQLCPSELGLPNRRRRFYLVASQDPLLDPPTNPDPARVRLRDLLDPDPAPDLVVSDDLLARYAGALNIVDAEDADAVTACFTSAYGRSPVRSGSYLRTSSGVRRCSAAEILRLLDFPGTFTLPPALSRDVAWRLVGNSLSVRPVRWVLAALPGYTSPSPVMGAAAG